MSENTATRKAVVTTAQVQAAFANYVAALVKIGDNGSVDNEFDKGFRGRGFAEYNIKGEVVRSFDTKEDALTFYSLTANGMWVVLDVLSKTPEERPALKAEESAPVKPATTRKTAEKVSA